LNYDALYPWGKAKDVVITGAERTTAYPMAQQIAKTAEPWRSRAMWLPRQATTSAAIIFSLAHAGVPAFSIEHRPPSFAGKPAGWGKQAYEEYNSKHYHHPSDEFQEDWDFTALQQAAGVRLPAGPRYREFRTSWPDWRPGEQFPPVTAGPLACRGPRRKFVRR